MAGVDIEIDNTLLLGHEFFGQTHPSRNSSTGQYRFNNIAPAAYNLWHAYMAVCSSEYFDEELRTWLTSCKGGESAAKGARTPEALADQRHFTRTCQRRPDRELGELINRLLNSRPPEPDPGTASLEPAAVRLIQRAARGRCLELGSGSGAGTKALLRGGALAVVSVDHLAKFTELAQREVSDERVKFLTCPRDPVTGFYDLSTVEGLFDFILVDGPPGGVARQHSLRQVLPKLAPGGTILQDDAKRDLAGLSAQAAELGLPLKMLPTRRGLAQLTVP
jgi:SAM-dependent methyltransferase